MNVGPVDRLLKFAQCSGLVKPPLVIRHDRSRADQPDSRLALLDNDLSASKLLAEGDLPIRSNDLDC